MSQPSSEAQPPLPTWFLWLGSLAIIFHLGAVGVNALAAPSGPWPGGEGDQIVGPPLILFKANSAFADYLKPIHLTSNYHVLANRIPGGPGVQLEFRLQDEEGKELATVKLPDDNANSWVRHRQSLLLPFFWSDRILTPQSAYIAAPGREVEKVQYWEEDKKKKGELKLETVSKNDIRRDKTVSGPPEATFLFARSYARYLCRTHGATKVELVRHHQNPFPSIVLMEENVQARQFDEVTSNFGEFTK